MAQSLKPVYCSRGLRLVPSTHVGWFMTTHNSSFSKSDTLFWPLCAPTHIWHSLSLSLSLSLSHTHTQSSLKKMFSIFSHQ